jgi:hypothetical protein
MSRSHSRKATDVQAEAPAPQARAVTAEPAPAPAAEPARLSTGWKVALAAWLLCFFGLGLYELWGLIGSLLFR